MVNLPHKRQSSSASKKSEDDDATVVEPEQGNILSHLISQLRPGADLSKVTLPTFILEPKSMLERITNSMAHPDTLLPISSFKTERERFLAVVKFYLSGWHIKPSGVKKPLNPILGEKFTCYWDYSDPESGKQDYGLYISEQTSHHPPKSSYFFIAPNHGIRIDGTLKPRSKFLGNSAASIMEGTAVMRLTEFNEMYFFTQPNMYARGILFGKMKYELGDHSSIKCPNLGLEADIEFKTKAMFGGDYSSIGGTIKNTKTGKTLYTLSGHWDGEMFYKDNSNGQKVLIFDATKAKATYPTSRPIEEQQEHESQRLWDLVNAAIVKSDHVAATEKKSKIEDAQRDTAKKRTDDGQDWEPKLFRAVQGSSEAWAEPLDWIINANIDGKTPEEITKQVLAITPILPTDLASQLMQQSNAAAPESNRQEHDPPAVQQQIPDETRNIVPRLEQLGIKSKSTFRSLRPDRCLIRQDSETHETEEFFDAT